MKLVFVYNANSGRLNALFDIAHKILRPETYACALCSLTHGVFQEKQAWAKFCQESGVEIESLHRDEFEHAEAAGFDYPVIFQEADPIHVVADAEKLASFESVEGFIKFLEEWVAGC